MIFYGTTTSCKTHQLQKTKAEIERFERMLHLTNDIVKCTFY